MWGQAPELGFEMVTLLTFLARYGTGGGTSPRRRMPKGSLMSGFEKPPAPTPGKGAGYSFARMSGMLDLSRDEKVKHFLPRWLRYTFAVANRRDSFAKNRAF